MFLELISDNKSYNSETIVAEELDTIRLLGRVGVVDTKISYELYCYQ